MARPLSQDARQRFAETIRAATLDMNICSPQHSEEYAARALSPQYGEWTLRMMTALLSDADNDKDMEQEHVSNFTSVVHITMEQDRRKASQERKGRPRDRTTDPLGKVYQPSFEIRGQAQDPFAHPGATVPAVR